MGRKSLLSIFSVLWLADTVFSLIFIGRYGLSSEANPICRFMIEHFGNSGFVGFKVLAWLPLALLYSHVRKWIYYGLILIMLPVVFAGGMMAFG